MWGTLNPFPFFTGGSQPTPAQRYILTHNGVNSYIDVGSIVYTGDYSRSVKFIMPVLSSTFVRVWGKDLDFTSRFLVSDDGSANIRLSDSDNVGVNLPAGTFSTGVTYAVTVSRAGSSATVSVNGTDFNFSGVSVDQSTFNYIQRMSNTSYGLGAVFDYTDSLGNNYPIDDNSTTVIRNAAIGARQRYWFTGSDDYMTIPQVNLAAGDTIEFKFIAPSSYSNTTNTYLLSSSNDINTRLNVSGAGQWAIAGFTATIDGNPMNNGGTPPTDGLEHTVVLVSSGAGDIGLVGSRFTLDQTADFPIYDIDIKQGGTTPLRFYAVNEGSGSTVIDSVSGQNGNIVNHKELAWTSADSGNAKPINVTSSMWSLINV